MAEGKAHSVPGTRIGEARGGGVRGTKAGNTAAVEGKPKRKYLNKKTEVDGIVFDSKKEAKRYCELRLLERAGHIDTLTLQPRFTLIPGQRRADGKAERAVVYIADFMYRENGQFVVEDTKGFRTADYIIKRKLMLKEHGITVREI